MPLFDLTVVKRLAAKRAVTPRRSVTTDAYILGYEIPEDLCDVILALRETDFFTSYDYGQDAYLMSGGLLGEPRIDIYIKFMLSEDQTNLIVCSFHEEI